MGVLGEKLEHETATGVKQLRNQPAAGSTSTRSVV